MEAARLLNSLGTARKEGKTACRILRCPAATETKAVGEVPGHSKRPREAEAITPLRPRPDGRHPQPRSADRTGALLPGKPAKASRGNAPGQPEDAKRTRSHQGGPLASQTAGRIRNQAYRRGPAPGLRRGRKQLKDGRRHGVSTATGSLSPRARQMYSGGRIRPKRCRAPGKRCARPLPRQAGSGACTPTPRLEDTHRCSSRFVRVPAGCGAPLQGSNSPGPGPLCLGKVTPSRGCAVAGQTTRPTCPGLVGSTSPRLAPQASGWVQLRSAHCRAFYSPPPTALPRARLRLRALLLVNSLLLLSQPPALGICRKGHVTSLTERRPSALRTRTY